ncbi:unnamed protein product [Darwinula stevensoni]|uniref:non-specific serine/threonine protein kinase n=1 Tax=Darwinula stevensoni TaxID=69355 RepID=A0A7R9A1L5_9CRUS|nr:unnamed protein product [Darwinula stevensoni]CAG0883779.1 unnamed protein product [Darwinula stevensoni]
MLHRLGFDCKKILRTLGYEKLGKPKRLYLASQVGGQSLEAFPGSFAMDKGEKMGFDFRTIQEIQGCSRRSPDVLPTMILLEKWSFQNHTVEELFVLFSKMQNYEAMRIIQRFVPERYHPMIHEGERRITNILHKKTQGAIVAMDPSLPSFSTFSASPPSCSFARGAQLTSLREPQASIDAVNFNAPGSKGHLPNKDMTFPNVPISRSSNEVPDRTKPDAADVSNPSDSNSGGSHSPSIEASLLHIPYSELVVATDSFAPEHILGRGGFGIVYKGVWKHSIIAIKKIDPKNSSATSTSQPHLTHSLVELRLLNQFRHDNILPLYGYSIDRDPCIVYQFMPNGSLEDKLLCKHEQSPLGWLLRAEIALGVARGLQFLHSFKPKPLIHGDVKSANILLDGSFIPKLGDFGLAKEGPDGNQGTHMTVSRVHGTRPYLPEEYLRSKHLSDKVDVYSYGIVLFELGTGLRAYQEMRKTLRFLNELVEACVAEGDGKLEGIRDEKGGVERGDLFMPLMQLGLKCTLRRKDQRPDILTVFHQLNSLLHPPLQHHPTSLRSPIPVRDRLSPLIPSEERSSEVLSSTDDEITTDSSSSIDSTGPLEPPAADPASKPTCPTAGIMGLIPNITELGLGANQRESRSEDEEDLVQTISERFSNVHSALP